MNAQDDKKRFEDELSEAFAADDVFAALGELARRHAGDVGVIERIEAALRLVGELTSVGERLAEAPVPPMQEMDLSAPARRVRPWWIAIPAATAAATAAAAAVLLAVFLTNPPAPTTRTTDQAKVATTAPTESGLRIGEVVQMGSRAWLAAMSECSGFNLPAVESPQWPSLEMPAVSMPTISGLGDTEFSIPTFTWPELTERSTNDET